MSKQNIQNGSLEYMQFILTDTSIDRELLADVDTLAKFIKDGTVVRVRYNQDKSLYDGTDTPLFSYTAKDTVDGVKTEVTKYAVPYALAKRATRTSIKESMLADVLAGMSNEELLAKYGNK